MKMTWVQKSTINFFDTLRDKLVPFVLSSTKKKQRFSKVLTKGDFDIEGQKEFSKYLLDVFNYDQRKGNCPFKHTRINGISCK